jgi:hypothetical protein
MHIDISKNVVYWAKTPLNGSLLQKCNTCINHICLVDASSTKSFYDPYASITFQDKKLSVWFVNVMWVLRFEYLQFNLVCDPNVGIVIYIFLNSVYFYDPNVSIANVMFISMTNKYQKYEYSIFCIDDLLCL